MNQKLVKRIRRNNRIKYPRTNEPIEQYERDIRRISKEDRKLLVGVIGNPKPIINKRQDNIRSINKFKVKGFPSLNIQFMVPVTFLHHGKKYHGRYGRKVISKSIADKL